MLQLLTDANALAWSGRIVGVVAVLRAESFSAVIHR